VRRLLTLLLGGLGLGAWWRLRRPRRLELASPAEELRAKLAETRAAEEEPAPVETGTGLDPESRRRDVHERARKSLDELG
jgi:hypothetical protein